MALPVRRGQPRAREVQPRLELSHRLVEIGGEEIRDPEVHVDGGGGWEECDGALQALPCSDEVPRFAQRGPEKRVAAAVGGIEVHALAQLGQGPIAGAAVPEGHPEVEVGFRGLRPERHRPLEVGEGGRKLSLLAQDEAQEVVRLRVCLVPREGLGELRAGGGQVAAPQGLAGALDEVVGRAWRRGRWPAGGGLLLQGRAQRNTLRAARGFSPAISRTRRRRPAGLRSGGASARARTGRRRWRGRLRRPDADAVRPRPERPSPAAPSPG